MADHNTFGFPTLHYSPVFEWFSDLNVWHSDVHVNGFFKKLQVAFITYDRSVHFYTIPEGANQPTQLTVSDIDGEF